MSVTDFIAKWSRAELPERAASQEHFLDLCHLIGVKTPAELDPTGDVFTFEKAVKVSGFASAGSKGERGFADVWYKDRFGWEYKRKGVYTSLAEAYRQLCQYRDDLGNPPLLIVSDIARTEIHTNFTGFKPEKYEIELAELADPDKLALLRRAFLDPGSFKPSETPEEVTKKAAAAIGSIAQGLRDRGHDPHDAAHFLMKVMFSLFAEDVELLPKKLFESMLGKYRHEPVRLKSQMDALFNAMRTGGDFGIDEIAYFNGGLFDDASAIELTETEIGHLVVAASKDWSKVEPSVFGTLFERSLDPSKRSQIGAHYTSREDIMLVIEPVILRPLRREWEETQSKIADQLERRSKAKTQETKKKANQEIEQIFDGFQDRLASVRVLDPACGSGNFLYVAIQSLLELEGEVIVAASDKTFGIGGLFPKVRPTQLSGIEINTYASELAQVVIWIGYLQWMRDNGFVTPKDPVLESIDTIENRDAILAWEDEHGDPIPAWREGAVCAGQAAWPDAEFIVGNPPFLGAKIFRDSGVPDAYIESMYAKFGLPKQSDLCCYWFAKAGAQLRMHPYLRAGLLATQAIRNPSNRAPLISICDADSIFDAWSDREWVLDGASVHVSIICFTSDEPMPHFLDGSSVTSIGPGLTSGVVVSESQTLEANQDVYARSPEKGGNFDIDHGKARELLGTPSPNGKSATVVVKPWMNANRLSKKRGPKWIIDFHNFPEQNEAAGFEAVFAHIEEHARSSKAKGRTVKLRDDWWLFRRSGDGVRQAMRTLPRLLVTPMVSKFRLFAWISSDTQPDKTIPVFARSDDYFFGVLHSSVHELWARRQGTQLREAESGFRYTPTTCFETFPLPWAPGEEPPEGDPQRPLHDAIGDAAAALNDQRERWLNPPEWIEQIAAKIDAEDDFSDVARVSGEEARRLIRQSAIDAAAAKDKNLKKRTLTNLYNERPTWLRLAHKALDEAVLAAYAAVDPQGAWSPDQAEPFEDTGAGQPLPDDHPMKERREETEQSILADLLRLNLERAAQENAAT